MFDFKAAARRSELCRNIRSYFDGKGYLEVYTPTLSPYLIPEPTIKAFKTEFRNEFEGNLDLYMIPSPEIFMKKLLAEGEFRGTATELVAQLESQGSYWSPAILSKYLQCHDEALAKCGILLETKRTNSKRLLCLRYEAQAGDACDTSDGSDGCDSYSRTGGMPSLPSQPSPASRPSLAS